MKTKNVLITGGSRGLGLEMAKAFKTEVNRVIITGRDKAVLNKVCQQLGNKVEYEVIDFSGSEQIQPFVNQVIAKYSHIDVLINNAGMHLKKDMLELTDKEFEQVTKVNMQSVFSLSREIGKHMVSQKSGAILNVSSMASQYGIPKVMAYTAAKSAIEGMTRAMAVELSPYGVRVNCIAPGFIKTDMSSKALDSDPERKAKVLGRTPLGRLGLPAEVADAAYYLCSDKASFITGVVLPVDGGNSIGF